MMMELPCSIKKMKVLLHVKVMEWKPLVDHLRAEILLRYDAYSFEEHIKKLPMKKSWNKTKCMNCLFKDVAIDSLFVAEELPKRKCKDGSYYCY